MHRLKFGSHCFNSQDLTVYLSDRVFLRKLAMYVFLGVTNEINNPHKQAKSSAKCIA